MNRRFFPFVAALAVLSLTACEQTKDKIGLTKEAPDEFKVVRHAPLDMPPDYALRPPAPGAPRPQESATSQQAAKAVFGEETTDASKAVVTDGESALLNRAGANAASSDIRRTIDQEAESYVDKNRPVAQRLLDITTREKEISASVVDAKAEAERLQQNAQDGKPVTEGETPSIDD